MAGGGRVRRLWPQLHSRLHEAATSLTVRWTTGPKTATPLTQQALRSGFERIAAVGGDGTLHEVVNGFFDGETPINASAVLVHIACGSGSDFRRTLGAPGGVDAVRQLQSDRIPRLDLLRVQYTTEGGETARCYAINIASFGLSGTVVRHLSERSLPLPPRLRYLAAGLWTLATTRPVPIRLTLDGEPLGTAPLRLVAVANGHSFAAGLPIAPSATPRDGQFDVTILHDVPVHSLLGRIHRFYWGTHPTLDGVHIHRGRRLTAHAVEEHRPVWLEADGEQLGRLPVSIEVIPQALRVQH